MTRVRNAVIQKITCALMSMLLCLGAFGADDGTLKGTLKDPSGAVVSGVRVHIAHWGLDPATRKTTIDFEKTVYTDEKGNYSVQLSPGVYDVFFSSPAFAPSALKVSIKASEIKDLSPKLKYDRLTRGTD